MTQARTEILPFYLTLQAIRTAGAIPALVMVVGERNDGIGNAHRGEDASAGSAVVFDMLKFGMGETGWFMQECIGKGHFADIVQESGKRRVVILAQAIDRIALMK
jgi:hypothetical protein